MGGCRFAVAFVGARKARRAAVGREDEERAKGRRRGPRRGQYRER